MESGALGAVRGLTRLRSLSLYRTEGVTDRDLAALAPLRSLKSLRLYREDRSGAGGLAPSGEARARITDAGLRHLTGLTSLTDLDLSGPGITDAGLAHLRGLVRLERLSLYRTRVTPAGRAALRRHLPRLEPE